MVEEAVAALAASGATALVGAMATDTWQTVRAGAIRLFRGGGDEPAADTESRLDDDQARLAAVEEREARNELREGLAPWWQARLLHLLHAHPERAAELHSLLGEPAEHPAGAAGPTHAQYVSGHGSGVVIGVQNGNAYNYAAPQPFPPQPPPPTPSSPAQPPPSQPSPRDDRDESGRGARE
ncbi:MULTISPECIES: hypothetical protein [unclassified Streptomyces]|uniref:hypothetical protein n=1 Tax=unclassified Streptomyces TaxID=2593676 RepID=UPI002E0EB7FA|nr:hypothetical protein OG533_24975 [Streptomyces sp. NBC_01186]WSS43617.1 hypothetical protein OG220_25745 [Streptomyces sp. NBC_01187]